MYKQTTPSVTYRQHHQLHTNRQHHQLHTNSSYIQIKPSVTYKQTTPSMYKHIKPLVMTTPSVIYKHTTPSMYKQTAQSAGPDSPDHLPSHTSSDHTPTICYVHTDNMYIGTNKPSKALAACNKAYHPPSHKY